MRAFFVSCNECVLLKALLVVVLICSSLPYGFSRSVVTIQIPLSLRNHNKNHSDANSQSDSHFGEEHVTATYGMNQPQGSIACYVYSIDHNLCTDWNDKNGTFGYPKHQGGLHSPFMLMVERSPRCSTVTQAKRAQIYGASALIVADNGCRCSDKECTDAFGPDCVNEEPVLVNDGSASDVSIPSFLLYRLRARDIRDVLHNNEPVLMEFTWGLKELIDPTQSNQNIPPPVHFQLWSTAHDPLLDIETYKNIKTIALAFSPQGTKFEPRYSLISGERFNCDHLPDPSTSGPCGHLCSNHGRYCALHRYNISGYSIVTETLRRLCVWQDFGTKDANYYWNYVLNHLEHCSDAVNFADASCSIKALHDAKIDPDVVERCINDSGGLDDDGPNPLLDSQLKHQAHSGVTTLPALVVENRTLDEPTSFHLWEGLCRTFWSRNLTTTPDVCFKCGSCPNVIGCLEAGHCVDFTKPVEPPPNNEKKHRHGWAASFWIISIVVAAGGGYYYYYRRQIDAEGFRGRLMGHYFRLSGEDL